MEELAADLARVSAERARLQRQVQKQRARERRQREQALQAATIAFCHEPSAAATLARATLRRCAACLDADVDGCAREIEDRFLQTPVDVLAQWLDWSGDVPPPVMAEAKRLREDVRLLSWVGEQNSAQGVAPPPQFVWEKRCALAIDNGYGEGEGAASWRPARSAAARKWLQRFRRRWGLALGRLPVKDILPAEVMQAKAANPRAGKTKRGVSPWGHFGVRLADLVFGPPHYFT